MLLDKLSAAADRVREIEQLITLPQVVSDGRRYAALMREYKGLVPVVEKHRAYQAAERARDEARELADAPDTEPELRALAEEEYREQRARMQQLLDDIRQLLMPRDPNDERNVIVEIRQGAGGEEAALFAADLYRMYTMYAAREGYRVEPVERNETELGGFKSITFTVVGEGAYSRFKFESGVHRVQRVPVTESNGRIQTSTVTVAVLPEVDDVEIEIDPSELHFESCKSSGAGGQHINKTESAVRLTHRPTGIVIECDQERSQFQNKERALHLLRSKLYDIRTREQNDRIASERRSQIGSGDRSEKIRTYNFPQSRVTDHRINRTLYTLDSFLNGDIGALVSELLAVEQAERLRGEEKDS